MAFRTSIPGFRDDIRVNTVEDLYDRYAALDVPGYYEGSEKNPYSGLTAIIPRRARAYTMVLAGDEEQRGLARRLIRGAAPRRKIREVEVERHEIAFNRFTKGGKIAVIFA